MRRPGLGRETGRAAARTGGSVRTGGTVCTGAALRTDTAGGISESNGPLEAPRIPLPLSPAGRRRSTAGKSSQGAVEKRHTGFRS
ncbi:hypothetical protein GCM10010304_35860 [Streptomyces roseoviolaceus]